MRETSYKPGLRGDSLFFLFWLLIIVAAFYLFSDHLLDADEGSVLNPAWQLYGGKKLYVDFAEYIAPGSFYTIFSVFKIFGPSYFWAKIFSIIFWIISAVGVYLVAKKVHAGRLAGYIAVTAWLIASRSNPAISHNAYSSYLAVWLVYFALVFSRSISGKNLQGFLLGVSSCVIFFFLQTKGLMMLAVTMLLSVFGNGGWRSWSRHACLVLSGFLALFLGVSALLGPRLLFDHLLIFPFQNSYLGHTVHYLGVVFAAFLSVLLLAILYYLRKNKEILILAVFQAGLYLSSFNLADYQHFMINSFPFIIVISGEIAGVLREPGPGLYKGITAFFYSILFIALSLLSSLNYLGSYLRGENIYTLDLAGKKPSTLLEYKPFRDARYIYSGHFFPGLYFEFKKPNPFHYSNLLVCGAECQESVMADFKEKKPEYAIIFKKNLFFFNGDIPSLDEYIKQNYVHCELKKLKNYDIYAIKDCNGLE